MIYIGIDPGKDGALAQMGRRALPSCRMTRKHMPIF